MKKLLTTLLAAIALTSAVAAIPQENIISINVGMPFNTFTAKASNESASASSSYTMRSLSAGFSTLSMYSDLIGFYASLDLGTMNSIKLGETKYSRKEYYGNKGSQFSMNTFFGVAFRLLNSNNFALTVAPGAHLFLEYEKVGTHAGSQTFLGLGANANASYFITDSFGFTAGCDIVYDFFGLGGAKKTTDANGTTITYTNFVVLPKIGVTFKL